MRCTMRCTGPARRSRARLAGIWGLTLLAALAINFGHSLPVSANQPQVRITPESELRFGTFMVFGTGSRTVTAMGNVTDVSLVALEGSRAGPARFTVSYDRGNQSRNILDIELELVISQPARVRMGGVEGQLSNFETDLPGAGRIAPGQPIRINLNNCRDRVCSVSFNVGGRLEVSRQYGGASLSIPIPVDVTVISIDRRGGGRP